MTAKINRWEDIEAIREEHDTLHADSEDTTVSIEHADLSCQLCHNTDKSETTHFKRFKEYLNKNFGNFNYTNPTIKRFEDLRTPVIRYIQDSDKAYIEEAYEATEELILSIRFQYKPIYPYKDLQYIFVNVAYQTTGFAKDNIDEAVIKVEQLLDSKKKREALKNNTITTEIKPLKTPPVPGQAIPPVVTSPLDKGKGIATDPNSGFSSRATTPEQYTSILIEDVSPDKKGTLPITQPTTITMSQPPENKPFFSSLWGSGRRKSHDGAFSGGSTGFGT